MEKQNNKQIISRARYFIRNRPDNTADRNSSFQV